MTVIHQARGWHAVWKPDAAWRPRTPEEAALYALIRAGLLHVDRSVPTFAEKGAGNVLGSCPVCDHPTVCGWWSKDEETREWVKHWFPPTPCVNCRAAVIASGVAG